MRDDEERLILVDAWDREVGQMGKLEAHRQGLLHRAFSILVFDEDGRMLLQRRAPRKYHCGGLWSNACCGHPRPGESIAAASSRRLAEELGIGSELAEIGSLRYRAQVTDELVEHEFDHLFAGRYCGPLAPDPAEVCDTRWLAPDAIERLARRRPEAFTPWFLLLLEQLGGLDAAASGVVACVGQPVIHREAALLA